MIIPLSTIFSTAVIFLNICFSFFILFFERESPAKRIAWLLTLFFLPLIGNILYILLSGHFFTRSKKMTDISSHVQELIEQQPEWNSAEEKENETAMQFPEVEFCLPIIRMNRKYARSPLTQHNNLSIFTCGEDKFAALLHDMQEAQHSIHLQYFIFRADTLGKQLVSCLEQKAAAGIEIKLLLDDMGCILTPSSFFSTLRKAGGQIEYFAPIRTGSIFKLNYRNHRKIAVIDNMIGYTGGINVGDEYANQSAKHHFEWRDTSVRCTGDIVSFLQMSFLKDWYAASRDAFNSAILAPAFLKHNANETQDNAIKNQQIQMISSGPDDIANDEIEDAMIAMINTAKKSIYIQTPYFTPDDSFLRALKLAAVQGKDVRIMVPDIWDKWYVRNASFTFIKDILPYGIKVYHYPGFIHAKTIVIDTVAASIGSTNIDVRSFSLNFELNLFIYGKETAARCNEIFLNDQKRCRQVDIDWFATKNIFVRAGWGFCRLFTPIM